LGKGNRRQARKEKKRMGKLFHSEKRGKHRKALGETRRSTSKNLGEIGEKEEILQEKGKGASK